MVYQGSKAKYAKYIIPILQKEIDKTSCSTFIDAMVGGGHIIENIKCKIKIGMDINPYLIELYRYGQQEHHPWPDKITREDWEKAKNYPEQCEPWFVALVAYFTSYSARGFGGGYAMNGTRDYYHERLRNFEKQLPLIQDVNFKYYDFINEDSIIMHDCVIYLDPPYQGTKAYDYSKNFNYEKFWNKVRDLSKTNKVFVSEQNAPSDFVSVWSLDTTRNTFGSKSTKAVEKLFKIMES